MSAVLVNVAEAVKAELNNPSAPFSQAFVAERVWVAAFKLEELRELKVAVAPRTSEYGAGTRAGPSRDITIDVCVMKRLGDRDAEMADADGLMELVEEIAAYLDGRPLSQAEGARQVRMEHRPVVSDEHWREYRQFTSLLAVVYRVES